jgi:hypothetical protein
MNTATDQARSNQQFDEVIGACVDIFKKKQLDYGTAWKTFRPVSITDQIFIKALRLRSVQDAKKQLVKDSLDGEFKAIINYASMALMIIRGQATDDLTPKQAINQHKANIREARDLFQRKNHDYGEAWRDLRIRSMTDLILMKLLRIKQIEDNDGKTIISEGLDANYLDILNYAVFCLIRISEGTSPMD